jgi:putative hydrolase of the HAD superfamily
VKVKTLWVREPYLSQILAGRKTIEVRVGYDNIRRLQPGDQLKLNDEHLVTIRRIGRYASFEELLAHEDPAAIAPDLPPGELLEAIHEIYPPEKETLGAVALEIAFLPVPEATGPSTGPSGSLHPSPSQAGEGEPALPYSALLFDMGYTLVYFEPRQEIIVQKALRAVGAERSIEEIESAVRHVWGQYYQEAATVTFPATPDYDRESQQKLESELLAHLGLDAHREGLRAYGEAIESWFSRPGVMRPYPEVVDVLAILRQRGYRLGIVSNWSWNLRERVAQVGLAPYFEIVWASAYAGCNKPHPCIFEQALDRLQVPASRAFCVGDSYRHDVVGARNAGVDVALLDRSGTADNPDCPVIHNLGEIFGLLVRDEDIVRGR